MARRATYVGYRGRPVDPGPYYHGTTTALNVRDELLPPKVTGKQTEARARRRGKVFFTNEPTAACHYAKKAAREWGGEPVVFEIEPFGRVKQISRKRDRFGPAFHADGAVVVGRGPRCGR